jgi:hypothetical protein
VNATEHALLAVIAANGGDTVSAQVHLAHAQEHARSDARRDRQVVEIATLVVGGAAGRAAGLALEHIAQFPDDADLLDRVTGGTRADGPSTAH